MRVIDRYLLRQFVQVFVICFASLTGLYIIIDAFGHLDEFIAEAERQNGNLLAILGEFYAYRSLLFFDRTSGILALISAMFTVTWLQRHNEMTALLAAGIPKLRIVMPVLVGAVTIGVLAAANRELVVPRFSDKLALDTHDVTGTRGREIEARRDLKTGILLDGDRIYVDRQRIDRPRFRLPYDLSRYGSGIEADAASYQRGVGDRPPGYLFHGVTRPHGLTSRPSLYRAERPAVLTPQDTAWLGSNECFVVSDVDPEMLGNGSAWRQYASTLDLIRGLHRGSLDFGADVRVAVHTRFVQPLLDATLLMLGLPLVLSRNNRNVFLAIGLCVGVVALFMLVLLACQALGATGLIRPALAAWLPLMLFVPVAVRIARPLTH